MSKIMKLEEGVNLIEDGMTIAIGGNVLHRSPMAFLREIVRQGKKGLRVVKTAGGHDVDLLCAGGCVSVVDAGFISYETEYGLASHYRKAVQDGLVKSNEHACYTVISALRAAKAGVSFMPVKGIINSDLVKVNDYFKVISDPFTGEPHLWPVVISYNGGVDVPMAIKLNTAQKSRVQLSSHGKIEYFF
jgi:glutaconate CoA-transferase subunit A